MAGCYHDTQDFKTDLNIEVARESDILEAGQNVYEITCDKNPRHEDFIPFKNLTVDNLPIGIRNREILDDIKMLGSRVVRLVVNKIKNGRRIKEAGSGEVNKVGNKYCINTNNHVVGTDDEVKNCTVEFHYDDDSRSSIVTSRGVTLVDTCPYRDLTLFTFHPVPEFLYQLDWTEDKQPTVVIMLKNTQIGDRKAQLLINSDTSQIGFYSHLDLNSSLIHLMFISWHDGSISYLKSHYVRFQPIPSNTQEYTTIEMLFCLDMSLEIHIDDDDGHSKVIQGDVVKFGDEFVVKISESIFQDDVKKCRLVWNGEVIGRDTRLYFRPVLPTEFFSGIDLERGIEHLWIFECHPLPRNIVEKKHRSNIQKASNMCCIGHPHGGIKMVTFGRGLGNSYERFDNQYRHITQPNSDCKCKEVSCVKYSCKTCLGSSGSPVFELYQGIYSRRSYVHFLGGLVENINIAYCCKAHKDCCIISRTQS